MDKLLIAGGLTAAVINVARHVRTGAPPICTVRRAGRLTRDLRAAGLLAPARLSSRTGATCRSEE